MPGPSVIREAAIFGSVVARQFYSTQSFANVIVGFRFMEEVYFYTNLLAIRVFICSTITVLHECNLHFCYQNKR